MELKGEVGQARGKYIGLMQFFTVEMEDILLLPQVHLGHIVVGAFYLKLALLNLLTIYYLFDANHLGRKQFSSRRHWIRKLCLGFDPYEVKVFLVQ